METILIILAIVWVVIPILAKSKQKQAKEQAERESLARQRAAQAAAAQQAERARSTQQMRTQPLTPSVRPSQPSFAPYREGLDSLEGRDGAVFEGEPAHEVASTLTEAQSSLKQINVSADHAVSPSSESSHAHEESSMSGVNASCPPGQAPAKQPSIAASVAPASAESAFVWDPANARSGLVLAEVLGPCLALRE